MGKTKVLYEGKRAMALMLKAVGVTAGLGVVIMAPNALAAVDMFVKAHDKRKKSRLNEYVRRTGYFDIRQLGDDRFAIKLTGKGSKRLETIKLETYTPLPSKHKWDGKWHLIMFDIAERHKSTRDYIAGCIKDMNLAPVQDSVYAYPYPLKELAEVIRCRFPFLGQHVISLSADNIDGQEQLKKHFINIL